MLDEVLGELEVWLLLLLRSLVGGASGIGQATVERLANEGASVGIFDINENSGRSLAGAWRLQ